MHSRTCTLFLTLDSHLINGSRARQTQHTHTRLRPENESDLEPAPATSSTPLGLSQVERPVAFFPPDKENTSSKGHCNCF